jgi:photosystem II stability/assembly factor-like uncharacterized protein
MRHPRFLAICVATLLSVPLAGQEIDPSLFSALTARSIGPAGMSGRITAIDGLASDPSVLWVGAATGGVWKSRNGGTTWTPVFDEQRISGIGAVAIDQNAPEVVWVGTGEGNPRNSAGVGAGLYKTMDGGATWQLLGFEQSERIHRIVLHPTDSNVAWIGVMGPAWSDGEERGVYKTTDGGNTWQHVLWVNERTGVSDLIIDDSNPMKLFAAMWEFRREPWFFTSGGAGSGLYVSHDGGDNWSRYAEDDGMPAGELGRIGLAISPSEPSTVYALVEAEHSALLRSDNGGASWQTVNDDSGVANRPFYYADIFVDPENELRVYNLNSRLWLSEDGGRGFSQADVDVHSDFHAMWIDPNNPRHMLVGTDGGVWQSLDKAETWRLFDNLPVGQFYHVSVDDAVPYNVYGGMQDNGSWRGPSDVWRVGGIRNYDWREIAFGDGFNSLLDPDDSNLGYGMSQGGRLVRFDLRTGERKFVRPWAPEGTPLRFNWNAPLAFDPFAGGTVYYGSQFVHKSENRGNTWQVVSPDLTTNDPSKQRQAQSGGLTIDASGAENHTTLMTIAPSPVERDLVWTGSDDGKVHLSRAAGGTWEDLTAQIDDVPDATWIPHIEPSKHSGATAYVVFDDHRRGNWDPYLYRTDDYGNDWENVGRNEGVDGRDRGIDGFLHTVEEDPVTPNLLFAGGELGLFASVDRGERWFKWTHGLPTVPVRSLTVHPRDHDLVIGTHGRAIWILDDIRPLRAIAQDPLLTQQPVHLFEVPPAYVRYSAAADGYHFAGDAMFQGQPRPEGALLTYWLDAEYQDDVEITIAALPRETDKTIVGPGARGMNRISWDLRADVVGSDADEDWDGGFFGLDAPQVLPGDYTVTIRAGGFESTGTLTVLPDPRVDIATPERWLRRDAILEGVRLSQRLGLVQEAVDEVRAGVQRVRDRFSELSGTDVSALADAADALLDRLGGAVDLEPARAYSQEVTGLSSSYDAPTEAQRLEMGRLADVVDALESELNVFLIGEVARFRDQVLAVNLEVFPLPGLVGS